MLARIRLFLLVLVAATVVPSFAQAQIVTETPSTSLAGPRRDLTATAMRQFPDQQQNHGDLMQRRSRQNMGQPVALMLVGGAAVVLGALIGDDVGTVFMIGGAVALLIGLYQYVQ
jgi:hypothetical protein